jgi:hypothetical protein
MEKDVRNVLLVSFGSMVAIIVVNAVMASA